VKCNKLEFLKLRQICENVSIALSLSLWTTYEVFLAGYWWVGVSRLRAGGGIRNDDAIKARRNRQSSTQMPWSKNETKLKSRLRQWQAPAAISVRGHAEYRPTYSNLHREHQRTDRLHNSIRLREART